MVGVLAIPPDPAPPAAPIAGGPAAGKGLRRGAVGSVFRVMIGFHRRPVVA